MTDQTSQQPDEIDALITVAVNASFDCGEWDDEHHETYLPLAEKARIASEKLRAAVAALKHAQQAVEIDRDNLEGMAESMRMFRADMIKAGVIGESVPPMFMTEAILGAIGKARAEALEEVAQAIDASGLDQRTMFAWFVRGLKSKQPAQADGKDKS